MTGTVDVTPSAATAWSEVCLNCGATLAGPFCSGCGQRAIPPRPTTRELAGDAYGELVGWDGKLAGTVRLLLRRPGELTRLVLAGQRARYISPVRLYLACSLLYFIVAAGVPAPDAGQAEFSVGIGFGASEQTPAEAALTRAVANGLNTLTPAERSLVEGEIATFPRIVQPLVRAAAVDYRGLMRRVGQVMPRSLFALVPALAVTLALVYRRRHFPEHLYFALHFQALAFIMLTLAVLPAYGRSLLAISAAQLGATLWIAAYAVIAQRRVYGGSWVRTGLKAIVVTALFGILWTTTTLSVTLWMSRVG